MTVGTSLVGVTPPSNSMLIGGNLGLGSITNPSSPLHVGSASNAVQIEGTAFAHYLTLRNTVGAGMGILFDESGANANDKYLYFNRGTFIFGTNGGGYVSGKTAHFGNGISVGVASESANNTDGAVIAGNTSIGATASNARLQVNGAGASASTYTAQFQNSTGTNNALVIRDDGNVGLGTNAPTAKLHIIGNYEQKTPSGTVGTYRINEPGGDQVRGTWDYYINSNQVPDFFGKFGFKFEGGANNAAKQFQIHVSDAGAPKMVVNGLGNAGLGTINPAQTLHVQGTARITGNDGVATTIMGRDADGDISTVILSPDFNISNGSLAVSTSLDHAYNNFGASASKIVIDAAQGQTGGLEFESGGANNITFDLQGTGDWAVQDAGTNVFRIYDDGTASFGNAPPGVNQQLLVTKSGVGITVPLAINNSNENGEGVGVAQEVSWGAATKGNFLWQNPNGNYDLTLDINLMVSGAMTSMMNFNANKKSIRFHAATEYETQNLTGASEQISGRTSMAYAANTASTTTITLPEIVNGLASTNQVNTGYILHLTVNRSTSVTIQSIGGDIILIDGQSGNVNQINTTASTVFSKKFIAIGNDAWVVE